MIAIEAENENIEEEVYVCKKLLVGMCVEDFRIAILDKGIRIATMILGDPRGL